MCVFALVVEETLGGQPVRSRYRSASVNRLTATSNWSMTLCHRDVTGSAMTLWRGSVRCRPSSAQKYNTRSSSLFHDPPLFSSRLSYPSSPSSLSPLSIRCNFLILSVFPSLSLSWIRSLFSTLSRPDFASSENSTTSTLARNGCHVTGNPPRKMSSYDVDKTRFPSSSFD